MIFGENDGTRELLAQSLVTVSGRRLSGGKLLKSCPWLLNWGLVLVWTGCVSAPNSNGGLSWSGTVISPDWVSPEVGVHQGYVFDGKSHFLIDSAAIFRRENDPAWTVLAGNKSVLAGSNFNHLGDGEFWNGQLWIAAERVTNRTEFSIPSIVKVDPQSLNFVGTHGLQGIMPEISGLSILGNENKLFATSYTDGSRIWVFNLADLSPVGQIPLSTVIPKIQGVFASQDYFYISTEHGLLYLVRPNGQVLGYLKDTAPGSHQGIKVIQGDLWWLVDTGGGHSAVHVFKNILSRIGVN